MTEFSDNLGQELASAQWRMYGAGAIHAEGGEIPEGHVYCHIHHAIERIPRRVFVVCFECGHAWTRRSLKRAWRAERIDLLHQPIFDGYKRDLKWWWDTYMRRAKNIYFCQECIHDF